jgi:hypothetical protein
MVYTDHMSATQNMTTAELIGKLASHTPDRTAVLAILRTRSVFAEVVTLTPDERAELIYDLTD